MIIENKRNISGGSNNDILGNNYIYNKPFTFDKNIEGGGMLTLMVKGSLETLHRDKKYYDDFIPMHYLYKVLEFKLNKQYVTYDDRLFFLKSETGSGKTTGFVVGLYRFFHTPNSPYTNQKYFDNIDSVTDYDFPEDKIKSKSEFINTKRSYNKVARIMVTQPKVATAIEKARELSSRSEYYPGIELGKNIGFKTGSGGKLLPRDENGIIFATLGSLTAELLSAKDEDLMEKYNFIIIDECHERSIELDFALVLLKKFLKRNVGNPNVPLVIFMSATFDSVKYMDYFGANPKNYAFVKGESPKYIVNYLDHDCENIYEETKRILEEKIYSQKLTEDNPIFTSKEIQRNVFDILIFLPGSAEIKKMHKVLSSFELTKNEIFQIISGETFETEGLGYVSEGLSLNDAKKLSGKSEATRRIVLSTTVVETGLTIETLKWVIDIALQRTPEYNPTYDFSSLLTKPASKSSVRQRRGRAGRVHEGGIIYSLYKEEVFEALPEYNLPDIYIAKTEDFYLKMLYMNIKNPNIVFDKLDKNKFNVFIDECIESAENKNDYKLPLNNRGFDSTKSGQDTSNCLNMYNLGMIKDFANKVIKLNDMHPDIEIAQIETIYKLYPPKMLDNYADVSVLAYLQKIKSLGFLGTYLGYIASNIGFISLEARRLIMLSYVWKVSLTDLAIIGTFASFKRKDYLVTKMGKKIKNRYNPYTIFTKICKIYPNIGKKYSPAQLEVLICDEFIESLIIVDLYKYYLGKYSDKGLSYIEKVFSEMGIIFKYFMTFINQTFDVIDSFKKFGFEERFESINLFDNVDTFLDKIAVLKKCIESAYKNNIILYDTEKEKYFTQKGLEVTIPPKFGIKTRPKKLIYSSLFVINPPDKIYYETSCDRISILDGYC